MKKLLVPMLVLLLVLSLGLTGCSGTEPVEEGEEVVNALPMEGENLIMCGYAGFVPFRYLEEQDDGTQKVVGLDMDVLDELSQRLGFTYEYEDMPFASVIGAITSGRCDIAGSMAYTEERDLVLDFTDPYYFPLMGVFCAKDQVFDTVESLQGKRLVAALGTINVDFCEQIPNATVSIQEGGATWQEVISGRGDAYISDGAEVAKTAAENDMAYYILPLEDTKDYINPYRMLMNEGSPFVSLINGALQDMKDDGTLNEIIVKWCGEEFTFEDAWVE